MKKGSRLREFTLNLQKFANGVVPEKHLQMQKKIAFDCLTGVILKTPVDTGRARANWQIALSIPPTAKLEATDKDGLTTAGRGAQELQSARPFGVIWIGNNLPYAVALEYGHSGQAPQGMVRVTLAEIQASWKLGGSRG